MRTSEHIVVAGGGLGGLRAAEALRSGGFDGALTVVGDEHRPPYNRPPLSKQVLAGEVTSPALPTEDLAVSWRLATTAVALDQHARTVRLSDDSTLGYDGLIIATGCRARTWPRPTPGPGVHTLRTLEDAHALGRAVGPGTRVVIVGAGFLGSEAACALRRRGVREVSLVGRSPVPLAALGGEVGSRVAARHREHGVRLHLGTTVDAIGGTARARNVQLSDGTVVTADVILVALGAVPNTEWLAGSGLTLHRGRVLCDASCAAVGADGNVADGIVAAGDVATWQGTDTGEPRHLEHWSNAVEMAQAAAATLLAPPGQRRPYDPVPTFWTDQWDLSIRSVGWLADAAGLTVAEEDAARGRLVVEGHREGELVSAITINKPRAHIDYRRALAGRQLTLAAPAA